MSETPATQAPRAPSKYQSQREGLLLLGGIIGLMWLLEVVNWADSYKLDNDGIHPRNLGRLWGIFTSPFIHSNFAPHLLDNTIPLVFMGVIIALHGAKRLALVTLIVIVVGGLGTWLIGPSHTATNAPVVTIGASGVVFGYATYLFARGFFDRSIVELLIGLIVGAIWGGALLSSVVPHNGVSWQAHVCGAVGGVVAAVLLRPDSQGAARARAGAPAAGALPS